MQAKLRFKKEFMRTMTEKRKPHVHFMGIGGSALAGVAVLAKRQGFEVSGCDVSSQTYYTKILEKEGIKPLQGHNKDHLRKDVDLLAVSPAVFNLNPNHPEVRLGEERKILISWQKFVGEYLQRGKFVIAISGTHGKSTTTALVGLVLEEAGFKPTVLVGAIVPEWKSGVLSGQSEYFVCEADEFNLNFLNYSPSILIINNIEMDHPEFFESYREFKKAFVLFLRKLTGPKILIVNEESEGVRQLLFSEKKWLAENEVKVVGYFLKNSINFPFFKEFGAEIKDLSPNFSKFKAREGSSEYEFVLKILGTHNIANALGVLACAYLLGIKYDKVARVFRKFRGLERRFSLVGKTKKVEIFDDYAVHPTAIRATLISARQKFPKSRIWAVFEPHQFSRLRLFLDEFASSLSLAQKVIVTRIYAGREKNLFNVKEEDLVRKIGRKALFLRNFEDVSKIVSDNVEKTDKVIVFGAGDSYKLSRMILDKVKEKQC